MSSDAQLRVGQSLFVGSSEQKRDLGAALLWFNRASRNTVPRVRADGLFWAAWCYERGHGVAHNSHNISKARELYHCSAEHHFALARAWCLLDNEPTEAEGLAALAIYQDESLDRDSVCHRLCRPLLLGEAYEFGHCGLTPDLQTAITHYRVAAARRLIDGETRLSAALSTPASSSYSVS